MKNLKILIITSVFFFLTNFAYSQDIVFVNLQKILNESKAGKQAQEFLKKQIVSENKKLEKEAQQLKKEEKDLINKKKIYRQKNIKKV